MKCGKLTQCSGVKFLDKLDDDCGALCVRCSWLISFVGVALLLLCCSLLMPVSIVVSDGCSLIKDARNDLSETFGEYLTISGSDSGSSGSGSSGGLSSPLDLMQTCLDNGTLWSQLNMTEDVLFSSLNTSAFNGYNVSALVDWAPYNSMKGAILGLSVSSTGFDHATVAAATDSSTADTCNASISSVIDELKTNFSNIDVVAARMRSTLAEFDNAVVTLGSDLDNLLALARAMLRNSGNCGYMGVHYDNIYDASCGSTLQAVMLTVACMLSVALCMLFMILFKIIMGCIYSVEHEKSKKVSDSSAVDGGRVGSRGSVVGDAASSGGAFGSQLLDDIDAELAKETDAQAALTAEARAREREVRAQTAKAWIQAKDAAGKTYYYNSITKESRWVLPPGVTALTEAEKAALESKGGVEMTALGGPVDGLV